MIENLLVNVPGSVRDLEAPAELYAKLLSERHAALEMPEATCKPMGPLGHRVVHSRQVVGKRIVVGVSEQDHKTTPKVISQMPIVEIEASHTDWILSGEIGKHIDPAVRGDCRVDGGSLGTERRTRSQ